MAQPHMPSAHRRAHPAPYAAHSHLDPVDPKLLRSAYQVYEAPVELIEKQVTLLYHESDPSRIEVHRNGRSYGFLVPLNLRVNYRLKRTQSKATEIASPPESTPQNTVGDGPEYKSGKLFERSKPHGEL